MRPAPSKWLSANACRILWLLSGLAASEVAAQPVELEQHNEAAVAEQFQEDVTEVDPEIWTRG